MTEYVYNECVYCGKSVLVEKIRHQILYVCDSCRERKRLWDDMYRFEGGFIKNEPENNN